MRMSKRILAMLLAALMVASIAPMSVMQAAAENITEAIGDLGDALAVEAVETDAAALAEDGEAAPAETPEEPAQPQEEPAAEETAAEETAAQEPAETQAEPTETEQTETEPTAAETEAPAVQPVQTEATAAEAPAPSTTETTTKKPSAKAIQKAARRAPLKAGPEFSLGLMSVVSPTTRLITAIDVPPTLYCDTDGNIYTNYDINGNSNNNPDGFTHTNDQYYTTITVTAAYGVTNLKLYIVNENDEAQGSAIASSNNNTLSGSFPAGKSVSITDGFGMIRYRLDYDYGGKTYSAYAASCVKVKYHTASAWISQNGSNANATVLLDTRMIVDVSELLGKKGVSAVTSLYTNDLAKYKSDHNTSTRLSDWSQSVSSFSPDVYGSGKASWNGGTANSPTFSGNPGTAWSYGADSNWLGYSAIDYYFGANGSVNSGNVEAKADTEYAGMSLFINRASTTSGNSNFTGLYGAQSDGDISGLDDGRGSTDYVMAHVYYDPYVVNYSGKTSADDTTLRVAMEKGNRRPDDKMLDHFYATMGTYTTGSMPGYYRGNRAKYNESDSDGWDYVSNEENWNENYVGWSGNSINKNEPYDNNSQYTTNFLTGTGYFYMKATRPAGTSDLLTYYTVEQRWKNYVNWGLYQRVTFSTKGYAFAFNAVDRSHSHATVNDSLRVAVCKSEMPESWWESYRNETWDAYYNCGNLFTQQNDILSTDTLQAWSAFLPENEPGQLINTFVVPRILYTKQASNGSAEIITTTAGLNAVTNESYNTAVSITAASGVTNLKLYIVDVNDQNADLILQNSGNSLTGSFPGGKYATLNSSTHDGAVRYRLEYDYNGKTYMAYAASYARERPMTVGRWYWDSYNGSGSGNTRYAQGFCLTDTVNVSSVLGQVGAGASFPPTPAITPALRRKTLRQRVRASAAPRRTTNGACPPKSIRPTIPVRVTAACCL